MILRPDPTDLHWQDDNTLIVIVDGDLPYADPCPCGRTEHPPAGLVALIEADCDTCGGSGTLKRLGAVKSGSYSTLISEDVGCPDCIGGKQTVTIRQATHCGNGHFQGYRSVRGVPTALAPTDDGRYALTVEVTDD